MEWKGAMVLRMTMLRCTNLFLLQPQHLVVLSFNHLGFLYLQESQGRGGEHSCRAFVLHSLHVHMV